MDLLAGVTGGKQGAAARRGAVRGEAEVPPPAAPADQPLVPNLHPAGTGKLNGRSEQLLGQFLSEYPGTVWGWMGGPQHDALACKTPAWAPCHARTL